MFERLMLSLVARFKGPVASFRRQGVKIGEGCRIYCEGFGTEPWLVSIGNRVTITGGVKFLTHDGATWLVRDAKGRRYRYAPITIGDDVFVGENTILLPGVSIGNRCIVAAGSVVNRSIPEGSVAGGVPVRIIGSFDEYEKKVLASNPAEENMRGATYRERVDSIVDKKIAAAAKTTGK